MKNKYSFIPQIKHKTTNLTINNNNNINGNCNNY